MGDREKSWAWPRVRQARCPKYTIKEGLTLGPMPKAGLASESEGSFKCCAQGIWLASPEIQTKGKDQDREEREKHNERQREKGKDRHRESSRATERGTHTEMWTEGKDTERLSGQTESTHRKKLSWSPDSTPGAG